jgi:hypothetical protein
MTTERRSFIDPPDRLFRPSVRFFYSADRVFLSVKPTARFSFCQANRAPFFLSSRPRILFIMPTTFFHAVRFLSCRPRFSFCQANRAFLSAKPTAPFFLSSQPRILFIMPITFFSR